MSPEEALDGRVSSRRVSLDDLQRAFWVRNRKKAHPKTGEVNLPGGLFLVPAGKGYEGKSHTFAYDPEDLSTPVLVTPSGRRIPLEPAIKKQQTAPRDKPRRGAGPLQRLTDHYRGRKLPQAQAGFGLPEVFSALARYVEREVPDSEREATLISDFYTAHGPFAPEAFEKSLGQVTESLGAGRPLKTILSHIERRIHSVLPDNPKEMP
ncbi:MAG: hypothetical protein ACE5IM_11225, partial [Nitrospinota bacterium]